MNKDANKYYQIRTTVDEEEVLDRFKKFLEEANLSYACVYNPILLYWNVFIDVDSEAMKKVVNSAIRLFIDVEKYIRGDKLYERMW